MKAYTNRIPQQAPTAHLNRIQRQAQGRRLAVSRRKGLAQQPLEFQCILFQLLRVTAIDVYPALEEGPCQPALDPLPPNLGPRCALEPRADVSLEV